MERHGALTAAAFPTTAADLAAAVAWVSAALRRDGYNGTALWRDMSGPQRVLASHMKAALWVAGVRGPRPCTPGDVRAELRRIAWAWGPST